MLSAASTLRCLRTATAQSLHQLSLSTSLMFVPSPTSNTALSHHRLLVPQFLKSRAITSTISSFRCLVPSSTSLSTVLDVCSLFRHQLESLQFLTFLFSVPSPSTISGVCALIDCCLSDQSLVSVPQTNALSLPLSLGDYSAIHCCLSQQSSLVSVP